MNPVLERLAHERDQVHEMIDAVLEGAAEGDRDPTESERELLQRHRERLGSLEAQIGELADVEEQRQAARDVATLIRRDDVPPTPATQPDPAPGAEVVYRTFGEYARDELILRYDLIARQAGPDAREAAGQRVQRAVANTLVADLPGITPTQHLAQIIDVINKARPIVNAARKVSLTSGKLTYPKITQRPIVGKQATEKTELPSQKMTVAMQQVTAETFGGSGDLSWQAINWSSPDALSLFFDLMAEAYAKATETAAGTELGTTTQTPIAVAAPGDIAAVYKALAGAASAVYSASGHYADVIFCDVATAYKLAAFVTNVAPAFAAGGQINLSTGAGSVGGLRLVASQGLAANKAYVADSQALLVAETAGSPVEMRAVEPSIGGMELGVIGAFVAELVEPLAVVPVNPTLIPGMESAPAAEQSSGK